MDIRLEIEGNNKVSEDFRRMAKEAPDAIGRIIAKVALQVERFGKTYSPVDTGLMRSTIYPVIKSPTETWVGPKTFYAKFVEAHIPFMSAAQQSTLPSVQGIIRTEIRKLIK